jgi:hypothetical protein
MKDIPEYEGLYAVTEDGLVWTYPNYIHNGRFLKSSITKCGYEQVVLSKNGKTKHFYVHRLVAQVYLLQEENRNFVNHKNGIKTDNKVSNLEWVTPSENKQHAFKTGLTKMQPSQIEASRRNITNYNLSKGVKNVEHNAV